MEQITWRFFVSHAHTDRNKDGILRRFFGDLNAAVAKRFGIEESRTGFLDTHGIAVGMDWSAELGSALRTSKVLICLMSEAFLEASNCGREVHVFVRRRNLMTANGSNPAVILPLWWARNGVKTDVPKALSRFQWSDDRFPPAYRRNGIRSLLIGDETDAYQALIRSLVTAIAEGSEEDLPDLAAQELPEFSKLPNELLVGEKEPPVPPTPSAAGKIIRMPGANDPYEVNFVYVAPRQDELPESRSRDFYSERGAWFWRPYAPGLEDTIGQIVKLASVRYRSCDFDLDSPNIVEYLEDATYNRDQLAVLLVDPWATLAPTFRELLSDLDRSGVVNYDIVVIWNEADPETMASRPRLEGSLRLAFPRTYVSNHPSFGRLTNCKDNLESSLKALLEVLMQNAVDRRLDKLRISGPRLPTLSMPPRHVA